ncbi:MAG TPA: sulfotransferase [Acidimicrobiia bacterium]|nr:sulfotransferase [Acidimicrobiia bacterium]
MTAFDLSAERAVQQAVEQTGLDDLGDPSWRDGLERLVDALRDEAQLNELGAALVGGELTGYLGDRMRIIDYRKSHPELVGVDVLPPIVIVGQGRTGTTILHELLAMDPGSRVPLTWEVDHPVPPPETATYETDPRIAETDRTLAGVDVVLPGFMQMHPMGAQLPQECVRITSSDFRSMIFPTQYSVPSYARWLLHEADMAPAYRWHRMFLEHLQSRHPAARWVLKSPGHLWALDALVAEYPNALLVQTHRDPLRILASLSSLVAKLRSMASDAATIPRAAADFAQDILDGLDRSVDARESGTIAADRVVDLQFRSFIADPFATINEIYGKLGLELQPEAERRMREFFVANPSDKHGVHTYRFADTRLVEGEWRERARRYQEYFDVPSESLG